MLSATVACLEITRQTFCSDAVAHTHSSQKPRNFRLSLNSYESRGVWKRQCICNPAWVTYGHGGA